ncbi:MAG: hypothetical protein WC533_04185 [Candidatus Pacearchaeota archaeon]
MIFKLNKKLITFISTGIISIVISNLGLYLFFKSQETLIGITTSLIGFVLIYFAYYSAQIKNNEDEIVKIKEWIENKEEILNTIKDIIILKKISKLKDEK